ncbi:UDP-glucose 4-epimerase [Megasphaera cerevisiae DSM 20462]|jgi:UDP-glucose 4-epimerase|uniref:UDP-glucose 4-epimerase n=1 Tax=Megasphaera cerevisiae DSM 20462 TaxID=1122219 RepID=A0A0J6ZLH5_9FIRM|nr:UDP-glucose 4-epimerase GalE [Megasphaera cerevisiae]KMO85721.1 UDP-glucose 4-epimerase [Megasphaera cerevisiae DSM 20462]OKY52872.1 UDP-glucose 4-epimerase GalE [Megasphaera cerevisiae]SKA12250.1 UDP-galactose 4-epimerase [Megasphaera cerevisiae DSM 20462]
MNVLVTGGAGYIGSHTVRALLAQGHQVTVLDNLSRGHRDAVPQQVRLIIEDIHHIDKVRRILETAHIDAVMHFAAHSQVGESMENPTIYYDNNVVGSYCLLEAVRQAGVKYMVFSSTAAVYGEPEKTPITEDMPYCPTNVYGQTKLMIENMLAQFSRAYGLKYVALRYFNAAGAAADGSIGEDHTPETHLIPLILQTALGLRKSIKIFGTDYPTPDGTCIRDYIHVTDLADAHCRVLSYLAQGGVSQYFNLGSQHGFSVRDMIETAKQVTGRDFLVEEAPRRAGDPAVLVAASGKIREITGWQPIRSSVETIIADAWNWHSHHRSGYDVSQ